MCVFPFLRHQNKTNVHTLLPKCISVCESLRSWEILFYIYSKSLRCHIIPFSFVPCGEKEQLVSILSELNPFSSLKTPSYLPMPLPGISNNSSRRIVSLLHCASSLPCHMYSCSSHLADKQSKPRPAANQTNVSLFS